MIANLRNSSIHAFVRFRATHGAILVAICIVALGSPPAAHAIGEEAPLLLDANGLVTPNAVIPLDAPSTKGAVVAAMLSPSVARSEPGGGKVLWKVSTKTIFAKQQQQLMVLAAKFDDQGAPWVKLALPIRPNQKGGWVDARFVRLDRTAWAVYLSRSKRKAKVYRNGRLVRTFKVVVGARSTPTPRGLFAVYESVAQSNPRDFIGPWALHLTAFSDVLESFGAGPGRVALHGRSGASLADPLGTARSHGCVRMSNSAITWLARNLSAGTPVRIR